MNEVNWQILQIAKAEQKSLLLKFPITNSPITEWYCHFITLRKDFKLNPQINCLSHWCKIAPGHRTEFEAAFFHPRLFQLVDLSKGQNCSVCLKCMFHEHFEMICPMLWENEKRNYNIQEAYIDSVVPSCKQTQKKRVSLL